MEIRKRKPPKESILSERKKRKTDQMTKPNKSTVMRRTPILNKGKKKLNEDEDEEVQDLEMTTFEDPEDEEKIEIPIKRKFIRKRVQHSHSVCKLTGGPVPGKEARAGWPDRYDPSQVRKGGKCYLHVRAHYTRAIVDGVVFDLNDCCEIKADKGQPNYIGRIVEFFETAKKKQFITVKWFFRAAESVIQSEFSLIEANRVFASESRSDIPLECIMSKTVVVQASSNVQSCNFFYDMSYDEEFCTFQNLPADGNKASSSSSSISLEGCSKVVQANVNTNGFSSAVDSESSTLTLLDLYLLAQCGNVMGLWK